MNKKDEFFDNNVDSFSFDEIVDVFDNMLDRSVPFYSEIQRMVSELAVKFYQKNTNIYDLGCSTGNTILNISKEIKETSFVGIDNSYLMLKKAEEKFKKNNIENFKLEVKDLSQPIIFNNPSVVILLFTLQFIRPLEREILIKQIYENLNKNGCIILAEKVLGKDSLTTKLFIDLYYGYKKRMGYSELEISKKREVLENVLIPYTMKENVNLLRRNGFQIVDTFFTWYNFSGFIGIKK